MNAIEITNLSKHYKTFSLDNINLTLPEGCIIGLIGENGAGKTTTIKLMLNMLKKDSGSIKILGKDYDECNKEDIGIVLDESCFPECLNTKEINNILKNVYSNWNEEQYFEYISKFSLPLDKKFKEFSKGMKMKLSIIVAMSHNAKLLILDEPTSGLDPVVRDEILDIFNDFTRSENHSILISSHIVSDLEKLCDYIAFIHNGKLILFEEKDALLDNYGIIHCSKEELDTIDQSAIIGKKENDYGVSAVIKKDFAPRDAMISQISIEDLFVFMIKGAK